MKFSTRTTYGLRAIAQLAKNYKKGESMSLPSIAESENISLSYLERIFSRLKKANLVVSEKGMSGGYKISSDPKKINVFEIIEVLEGKIVVFHCLNKKGKNLCSSSNKCSASFVLSKVQKAVMETLKKIALNDLI